MRNDEIAFWNKVDNSRGAGACWPYKRRKNPKGYGLFDYRGKVWLAHRFAYTSVHGYPEGHVLHRCDNPPCCNPAHLYDGTHADNMKDMDSRGRRKILTGDRNGATKISERQARLIKITYASGDFTLDDLARNYGVNRMTIWKITSGRRTT